MTMPAIERQLACELELALWVARTASAYRLALEAIRDTPEMTLEAARHIAAHALGAADARRSTVLRGLETEG